MSALVECVPNFSEGRRKDVIVAIVSAISAENVALLDVSSDVDHNRTVVTFAGTPEAVQQAMFAGAKVAVQSIDLSLHSGVHPRMGAVDVVPFVPLRNISLEACAQLATAFGQRVGAELGIPVYLYEAAATRPERLNLADVRRGGYEALVQEIGREAHRTPDFGPSNVGPAGAMIIGARGPLIAFNAFLDTDDVEIARSIASTIRASGGGLPYLKALGLLVNGKAQVSMNIIDYRKTTLHQIMQWVRHEAEKYGVSVTQTELVGLIPQSALIDYAITDLQLPASTRFLTLEQRLGQVMGDYQEINFE